jgi:hypothetical protein
VEHLQAKMKNLPQFKFVSLLVDDKNAPEQLITFDPQDKFVQIDTTQLAICAENKAGVETGNGPRFAAQGNYIKYVLLTR